MKIYIYIYYKTYICIHTHILTVTHRHTYTHPGNSHRVTNVCSQSRGCCLLRILRSNIIHLFLLFPLGPVPLCLATLDPSALIPAHAIFTTLWRLRSRDSRPGREDPGPGIPRRSGIDKPTLSPRCILPHFSLSNHDIRELPRNPISLIFFFLFLRSFFFFSSFYLRPRRIRHRGILPSPTRRISHQKDRPHRCGLCDSPGTLLSAPSR